MKRRTRRLRFEAVESRRLLAANPFYGPVAPPGFFDNTGDITRVVNYGSQLSLTGTNDPSAVDIFELGNTVTVGVLDQLTVYSSFENLAGDRSDVGNFTLGGNGVSAAFSGDGVAGTRGFRPGYNDRAFALITVGTTTIDFNVPVDVSFGLRNIVELTPDVVGTATLIGEFGTQVIQATANGDPQSNNWDVVDNRFYGIGKVTRVIINNNGTGVTNIDPITFSADVYNEYTFSNIATIDARLRGGDDVLRSNATAFAIVDAGDGNDVVETAGRNSYLFGRAGDDVLKANSRSTMFGGAGDDVLVGSDVVDRLFGEDGDDILVGGLGRDVLFGDAGFDVFDPGDDADSDVLFTDATDFVLETGIGNDLRL